jgi:Zn-dependent peptidase ImmA (M78 family)
MLELNTCYTLSQVPYISDSALDQYAEAVVRDAMPEVLSTPTIIDVDRFIEFYLFMPVECKQISYDHRILAMTAFNMGIVQVVDQSGITIPLAVEEGTLIIDPILTEKRNFARRRFTIMHEAAHWLIHRPAFSQDNPFGSPGEYENQYLAAKEGRIDYRRSTRERSDIDRIERQADFLASALLMPKTTLRMAFKEFFSRNHERPRAVCRGRSTADDRIAQLLPQFIAAKFGVSKGAALIRLEKLNAITGKS